MHERTAVVTLVGLALCVALFGAAWVVAPVSCDGGLTIYSIIGVIVVCVQMWLPLGMRAGGTPNARFGLAALLATLGVITWFVAAELANVRFMCRLF